MVKSDEHMGRIKKKLYDEAAAKKAAAEARRQRDLKKFGKQVQIAKLQQRQKEKRETLEKINALKRSASICPTLLHSAKLLTDIPFAQSARRTNPAPRKKTTPSTSPSRRPASPSSISSRGSAPAATPPPPAAPPPSGRRRTKSSASAARSGSRRAATPSRAGT
ncbi:hypothetical protein VTN02DRAFT_4568 [Thermoascus thermophilus]